MTTRYAQGTPSGALALEHRWLSRRDVGECYRQAIRRVVKPGMCVVNLGAGLGVLAIEACRAGAARAYAIESSSVADLIPRIARANGFEGRLVAMAARTQDAGLPELGDLLIASKPGYADFTGDLLRDVVHAREYLVAADAPVIPAEIAFACAPVTAAAWYRDHVDTWSVSRGGVDWTTIRHAAVNWAWEVEAEACQLLSAPADLTAVDLARVRSARWAGRASFVATAAGVLHGLAGWTRHRLAGDLVISGGPGDTNRASNMLTLLPIEQPVRLDERSRIEASVRMDSAAGASVWTWRVEVFDAAGALVADHQHSTFQAPLLDVETLRKQAPGFLPVLSDRGKAALLTLRQLNAGLSVEAVAAAVQAEWPVLAPTTQAAAQFVRRVAGRSSHL